MSEIVWYFAYGSNMQPATIGGRRGVVPSQAVPSRLRGWQLVFDKPGLLPGAYGMGNVVEAPGAEVLGVAYAVSADDYAHIELTEGVLIRNYRRVTVEVSPLDGGPAFEAFTLTSDKRDASLCASRRYMGLLIEGAEAHGLPAEYVQGLRSCPAVEDSPQSLEVRAFIDRAMKKPDS